MYKHNPKMQNLLSRFRNGEIPPNKEDALVQSISDYDFDLNDKKFRFR